MGGSRGEIVGIPVGLLMGDWGGLNDRRVVRSVREASLEEGAERRRSVDQLFAVVDLLDVFQIDRKAGDVVALHTKLRTWKQHRE